jgi:hypothetical protein
MKNGVVIFVVIVLLLTPAFSGCTAPLSRAPALPSPQPPSSIVLLQPVKTTSREELTVPAGNGSGSIPTGKGLFVFSDTHGNADRPITVYFYRMAAWNQSGPILIVIPGAGRDGQSPRDTWVPYAERYSALLIVPEFPLIYYPTDIWYNLGNTYDDTNWVSLPIRAQHGKTCQPPDGICRQRRSS